MITLINHQGLKKVSGIQIQTPSPPIGLAYIGAYLKKRGISYNAIDACGEALNQLGRYNEIDDVVIQGLTSEQVVRRIKPDQKIIGITSLFSHAWPLVLNLASRIKREFPSTLIVVGGEHPTAMPEYCLQNSLIDIVVVGEGEVTFFELCSLVLSKQPWNHIDGIAYRDSAGNININHRRSRISDLDAIPFPDWDSWFIEGYITKKQVSGIHLGRSIPIIGSRGCPYSCDFCSSRQMWMKTYVFRNPRSIVDEMEYFKDKYTLDGFSFMDLTLFVDRGMIHKFADELIKRRLNIRYQLPTGTRCEAIDDELIKKLESSGLKNFALAPESGDEDILRSINKQMNLRRFHDTADRILKHSRMTLGCFIVLGFPHDSKISMKKTLAMIRRLAIKGIHDVTISQFTPYPGSVYFDHLIAKRKLSKDFNELNNIISFYSNSNPSYCEQLTSKQIYRWMIWMYLNFYIISFSIRPWRLVYNFWIYITTGIERTRYMRFFSDYFMNRHKWKVR